MNGLTLGAIYNMSLNWAPTELAYAIAYGATNGIGPCPGTNSVARNLVYSSLASYFNLTSPPPNRIELSDNVGAERYTSVRVPHQRKSFYGQGMWCGFYAAVVGESNYNLSYVTSHDNGLSFSVPTLVTTVPFVDASWALKYDSGRTNLHFIRIKGTTSPVYSGLEYRLGVPATDGTIAWNGASWQQVNALGNYTADPSVEVDSSGNVWTAWGNGNTTANTVVNKNSATDGTWANASGFPVTLTSSADGRMAVLASLTNGMDVVTYEFASTNTRAISYVFTNGDNSFSSEGNVTDTNVNSTMGPYAGVGRISCASSNGVVILTYQDTNQVIHVKSRGGDGAWGAETILATGVNTESSPQVALNGSEVVVVWGDPGKGGIYWSYNNGSWSSVSNYSCGIIAPSYEHVLIPQECNGTSMLLEWLTAGYETAVKVVP